MQQFVDNAVAGLGGGDYKSTGPIMKKEICLAVCLPMFYMTDFS